MEKMSLKDITLAVSGKLVQGPPELPVSSLFTDTRVPVSGGLFVALKGPRFNGHAFVERAIRNGAIAVLVSEKDVVNTIKLFPCCGAILVQDTRQAFLDLAAAYRSARCQIPWFAITGSVGRSSGKEMLAAILSSGAGWKIRKAAKNFNNEIGVPKTMLGVQDWHQAAILELGTSFPGEINRLASVARPNVAVITNAGPVHLEGLGSLEGVAKEKGALLKHQSAGDWAVLNLDDSFAGYWLKQVRGQVATFGLNPGADVRATDIRTVTGGSQFTLWVNQPLERIQLALPGKHNIRNALAATAAALAIGVDLKAIVAGLRTFMGVPRRLEILEVDGVRIIDDAYNANPSSFKAALEVLGTFGSDRKFIVAGDMLELGRQAQSFHRELGLRFADLAPYALMTVGEMAEQAGMAAVEAGLPIESWTRCTSALDAADRLRVELRPGDVTLIKGSNGVGLEKCVQRLTQRASMAAG